MKKLIPVFLLLAIFIGPLTAQSSGVTLKICDAKRVDRPYSMVKTKAALETQCGTGVEAWSAAGKTLIRPGFHPFVEACHYAYARHEPLVISPDMIWLMIAQGFAKHVDQNSEELRDKFVDFDGKKVLKVKRDGFTKGSSGNDWEGVFPEFTEQIGAYTGQELLNTTLLEFSTTGHAEQAAFEVTLMDAMSSYFIYAVYTDCAITEIHLEGTTEDWELILEKTQTLAQYDLGWWTKELEPILEEFVAASKGKVHKKFWGDIYKRQEVGSGSPLISGWVCTFFPYTRSGQKLTQRKDFASFMTSDQFPSGMSKADFYWIYLSETFQMEFLAGFVGVARDSKTHQLRPEIGWGIRDTGKKGIKKEDSEYTEDIMTPPGGGIDGEK